MVGQGHPKGALGRVGWEGLWSEILSGQQPPFRRALSMEKSEVGSWDVGYAG